MKCDKIGQRNRSGKAPPEGEAEHCPLFNFIEDGFLIGELICDAEGRPIDILSLEANPAAIRILSLDPRGRRLMEVDPDHGRYWLEICGRVAHTGESERLERYSKPLDRWFSCYIFSLGGAASSKVALLLQDCSERKRREAHRAFLAEITRDFVEAPAVDAIMHSIGMKIGEYLRLRSCSFCDIDAARDRLTVCHDWRRDGTAGLRPAYRLSDFISERLKQASRAGDSILVRNTRTDPRIDTHAYAALKIGAFLTIPFHRGGKWRNLLVVTDSGPRDWRADEIELLQELSSRIFPELEHARALAALRESEARFRAVLEATGVILVQMDRETRYRWVYNPHPDYDPSVVLGKRDDELSDAEGSLRLLALKQRVIESGLGGRDEIGLDMSDGRHVFEVLVEPLRDAGGDIVGAVNVALDVTQRKQTEAALQAANAQLREADRRKDDFLAMLAHELRNPLAGLAMAMQLIERPGIDAARERQLCEIAKRQIATLARLVDELLDVSRISRGRVELKQERVNLGETIRHALGCIQCLLEEKRHQIDVIQPRQAVEVVGDPVRLEQVLINLLTNAAKYTDPQGRIAVTLQRCDDHAELRVQDNGIGIEPELLDHVFDLFGQGERGLDRAQGGLGVGLTIVKHLVEQHGGRLEARSEGPGKGSEFIVTLPLAPEQVVATAPAPTAPATTAAAKRILVVDDNADAAESIALALKLAGHRVEVAYDGPGALTKAEAMLPELILLDIGLPGIDGYEVARRLRHNPRTQTVILAALTGYGQAHDRERAFAAGFDAHFVKPVDLDDLEAFVNTAQRR